jgi:cysteinyl-tRNA synthetase
LNRVVAALKQSAPAAWEGDSVPEVKGEPWTAMRVKFFESMDNDFGTAGAISILFDLAKETNDRLALSAPSGSDDLVQAGRLFRLIGEDILGFSFGGDGESSGAGAEKAALDLIVDLRNKIRAQKLWPLSDEIRDGLAKIGIAIEDSKDGSKWVRK